MAIGYIETAPIQLVFAFMEMVKLPAPMWEQGRSGWVGAAAGASRSPTFRDAKPHSRNGV